jgi:hypothetical protein
MKQLVLALAVSLAGGVGLSAQGTPAGPLVQQPPDLSGSWNRESVSGAGDKAGWGPRVTINQSGVDLEVQPVSGPRQRYKTDGTEVAEVLSSEPCRMQARITKTVPTSNGVTITTWLITQRHCFHGETERFRPADPEEDVPADATVLFRTNLLKGQRLLESITVVSRQGNTLNVETTRSSPGGAPVSASTTYRK